MRFKMIWRALLCLAAALSFAGCSEPKCPKGWIMDGNLCRRCPRGMERIPGMCVPLPGDGGEAANSDAGEEVDGATETDADTSTVDDVGDAAASLEGGADPTINCSVGNGGCSHNCVPLPEGRRCSCRAGHALQADGTSCQLRTWKTPVAVETSSGGANYPQIAADADGNAAVVWEQQFGDALYVWLSTYSPSRGWAAAPEQVSGALATSQIAQPQVQLYDGGNVLVVWAQSTETWVRKRSASGSFTPAERLSLMRFERFFANQSGGVALISSWRYTESTDAGVVQRTSWLLDFFDPKRGWRAETLPFGGRGSPQEASVILDNAGRQTVIWRERNADGSDNLWAQRNRLDGTWEAPVALRTGANIGFTRAATNGADDYIVSWTDIDASLWASTFSTQGGWSAAEQVTKVRADGEVAVNADGNAILLWRSFEPVFATYYSATEGWKAEERVSLDSQEAEAAPSFADDDLLPRVAFLPDGSAVAVWPFREEPADYNGRHDIWSSVYLPDSGWQTPEVLDSDDTKTARDVRLATSSSGTVFAIWTRNGSNGRNLWTSRFE